MVARKDIHRPAEIRPADYRYLFGFSYPTEGVPGVNTALLAAVRSGQPQDEPVYGLGGPNGASVVVVGYHQVTSPWGKLPFFEKVTGSQSGCDVCGAHYRHGDAWLHEPSGEVVLIGHICSSKMDLLPDRGDWLQRSRELAQLRKSAEYAKARAEQAEAVKSEAVEFLRENEGLAEALEVDHYISRDLKAKLWRYGSLSENQVALAVKLQREAEAPPEPELPPEIEPPEGRREIEAEVLSTKWQDDPYGYGGTLKMLVQVGNGSGRYRLYGTVPSAIADEVKSENRVRFTATVQPKERGFGFFSRPAKAEILEGVSP